MLALYENIRKLRLEKGMAQTELARLTGYTDRSSIAKIEKGEVDLTQSKIILFAKALDVKPGELMGWETVAPQDVVFMTPTKEEREIITAYRKLTETEKAMIRRSLALN